MKKQRGEMAEYRPTRLQKPDNARAYWEELEKMIPKGNPQSSTAARQENGACASPNTQEMVALSRIYRDLESQYTSPRFDLIPASFICAVANRFSLGARKYGENAWRARMNELGFTRDRANHALQHLLNYIHAIDNGEDGPTDNLAAVAANMAILIEIECLKKT